MDSMPWHLVVAGFIGLSALALFLFNGWVCATCALRGTKRPTWQFKPPEVHPC